LTNRLEDKAEEIFATVLEKVGKHNLPLPRKPAYEEKEFEIPTDPDALNTIELGQKMMQSSAFYAYAKRLLGVLEAELIPLEAEYKLRTISLGNIVRRDPTFKSRSAEIIEAEVLSANVELLPLHNRKVELQAIKALLESRADIYDRVYLTLSRELSRRGIESRVQG
jgi:hypothetical protein